MRPSQLAEVLPKFFKAKKNVLLQGPPGCGKTSIVKQATDELGYDLRIWHPVVMQPIDIKGMPWVYQQKGAKGQELGPVAKFLPFSDLQELIEADKPLVCFADDLGHATPAVQAAFMQLLLAREIDGKPISDEVIFVAATNRKEDKAGVSGILEPVKSRFVTIIELTQDVDDWTQQAIKAGYHDHVVAYVNFKKEVLHSFKPTADLTNSPSARTMEHVSDILKMGFSIQQKEQLLELVSGAIGQSEASDFLAFLEVGRELPDPEYCMANPEKVQIPKKEGAIYVLVISMARILDKKNAENYIKFLKRLPKEYVVLGMSTGKNLFEGFMQTPAYLEWISENKNVILGRHQDDDDD